MLKVIGMRGLSAGVTITTAGAGISATSLAGSAAVIVWAGIDIAFAGGVFAIAGIGMSWWVSRYKAEKNSLNLPIKNAKIFADHFSQAQERAIKDGAVTPTKLSRTNRMRRAGS